MARQSTRVKRENAVENLGEEIQATRTAWNEGMESVAESWNVLAGNLRQLALAMFDSPLGKRAQRHPAATLTLASMAALTLLRLLRR